MLVSLKWFVLIFQISLYKNYLLEQDLLLGHHDKASINIINDMEDSYAFKNVYHIYDQVYIIFIFLFNLFNYY